MCTNICGLGLDFEPIEGLIIRPIIHLGWSRIKDNSEQASTNNPVMKVMKVMQQMFRNIAGDDINVFTAFRATQLNVEIISTSTPGLEESSKFHSLSGDLELDGRTHVSFYGRDMRWQYFMGATQFDSAIGDALKFNWIGEVGMGFSLVDNHQDSPIVEVLGVTASAILGDNDVRGWTFGIKAYF